MPTTPARERRSGAAAQPPDAYRRRRFRKLQEAYGFARHGHDGSSTDADHTIRRGWVGETCSRRNRVGLTVRRLTRAARAYVATAERHAACPHFEVRDASGVTPRKLR